MGGNMKIQCPNCSFASQIDESKIPDKGAYTRCRKCNTRFFLSKENKIEEDAPSKEDILRKATEELKNAEHEQNDDVQPQEEMLTCPSCSHEQYPSESCIYCGKPLSAAQNADENAQDKVINQPSPHTPKYDDTKQEEDPAPQAAKQNRPRYSAPNYSGEKGLRYLTNQLFDFSFSSMIALDIVKAIYALGVLLGGFIAAISFGICVSRGDAENAMIIFISYFLFAVAGRIFTEILITLFRIEENTRDNE
jgi:predicted Zn finger-like uncharacterized protein